HTPSSTLFPYTTLFRSKSISLKVLRSIISRILFHSVFAILSNQEGTLNFCFTYNHLLKGFRLTPHPLKSEKVAQLRGDGLKMKRSEEHTSELQSRFDLV